MKLATNLRDADATLRVNIQDFCEEYYEDIIPIIMDKVRRDKRKEVHARLDFEEGSRERRTREGSHYSSARTLSAKPERLKVRDHLSTTKSKPDRTSSRDRSRGRSRPHRRDSSNGDRPESTDCFRGVEESYDNSHSSYGTGINNGYRYRDKDCSRHTKRGRDSESPLSRVSKSSSSDEGHWRSKSKRHKPMDEDDLTMPWMCEEVERWAMPTWCHMFNSTIIGAVRVWFDELPPESIDSYKDLKAAFLAYFMQQKKYVKDPVEIHNIKQKDGETIKDFMERFKVETDRMKGAPECMRIFRFMHGVNNPELTKRLNEDVSKTMGEMMITTTAFIRGEVVAASKKKGHTLWRTQDQSKRKTLEKRSDFRSQPRKGRRFSRFTPLQGHQMKFSQLRQEVPAATTCTDECMQLKKQIEELVRAGKLSHLVKEIKQGRDQSKVGKKEAPANDKPTTIYMIQSWQRMTRQKVTQSFERVREITFPSLETSSGTEGPLVIEAKIGGHMIHPMYVDGGSSTEVLYEHCFNRIWPEVRNQMVPTTTSLTGFSEETIWPLGQLRLLVTIGDADHSTRAWMNFMIVRSLPPYNGIIKRPRIKEIHAVPSTAHGMLKFPAEGGILTIRSTMLIPPECATVITSSKEIPKKAGVHHEKSKVALHLNFPNQEVAIRGTLSAKGRTELCSLLKENLDIFVWKPLDMTGVPRLVAEHQLNIREGYSPVWQNKKGQASKHAKAIQAEVQKLVEAGIMREVYYHDWLSNPVMIQLGESDEEKTAFHTRQGVYYYTKMPFGLKNTGATYQRLVDKAFDNQIGRNIEVYVDDLVIKSHAEAEMLRDIGETFPPKPKEELIVYMFASYGYISAVLMTKRGMVHMPVYFVICALQGPKQNYTPMEKLVLLLVFAAKRLQRYFYAHPIAVITDQPIKQIMSRPEVAGRLQIWSVMLGEHNITYRPRTSMKRQVLADFLVKMPNESPPDSSVVETQQEPWTLFTDGSSCVDGFSAGLILTSPKGMEFTYTIRF
nr:reverse transcriptase domain-containing protein [Tanacetum cinerariifolium]